VAAILGVVYGATLAPGLTFWDAGELIAAIQTFGIPHPPGTPLYVVLGRAWRVLTVPLPAALGTNLWSAACSALAGGLVASLFTRGTARPVAAVGAGLCAGAMSTVWRNATETEVYAASLLLAMAMLVCAERAGRAAEPAGATGETGGREGWAAEREGSRRWRWPALTAYAMALGVSLHPSALVAAPAAVVLAAEGEGGAWRWSRAGVLGGAFLVSIGVALVRPVLVLAGAALLALGGATRPRRAGWNTIAGTVLALILALSVLTVMPIRAAHDPPINAGNPVSWGALWEVVGRRQYGSALLWPRQAPLWAQLANLAEYADWQVALGLSPGVAPSWRRTPLTLAFAALGIYGAVTHRRLDRRTWRAWLVLLLCASVGLVVYLNFKAGASFGYGVLPDDVPHEVRERDYFFTLGFLAWGAWAGFGAVELVRERRPRLAWAGLAIAALPIALNWRSVDRRAEPAARVAGTFARALLWSAPPNAVLVTGGDNDSFPLWYAQVVEGVRRDVTVVVAPLLGAPWYRAELARRDSLLTSREVNGAPWGGEALGSEGALLARVAAHAAERGRPVAVALTAGVARLSAVRTVEEGGAGSAEGAREWHWVLRGLVYARVAAAEPGEVVVAGVGVPVDTVVARRFVGEFGAAWGASGRESVDPAPAVMARVLACPARLVGAARARLRVASLDSDCNWR
jgi:hypothetical protein